MAFHIRDAEADVQVRRLARERGLGITDAVKLAVANELARGEAARMVERIGDIQRDIAAKRRARVTVDKAFFDELSGDD